MHGQTSPATALRIYRKMLKDLRAARMRLEVKLQRPGYDITTCLTAELVNSLEAAFVNPVPPVGVTYQAWRQARETAAQKGEVP